MENRILSVFPFVNEISNGAMGQFELPESGDASLTDYNTPAKVGTLRYQALAFTNLLSAAAQLIVAMNAST